MRDIAEGPSLWAERLGFGGLIPFVGLAAALWWTKQPGDSALDSALGTTLLGYGATIASFLGAIHWGLVMREAPARHTPSLLWGVVPSLLAWVALQVGAAPGLLLIAALLLVCFVVDRALYPRFGVQSWLSLRLRLTIVACTSCLAGAAALLR
jgi:hypothetical protein